MNKLIMDTLKPTNVPVRLRTYTGTADPYIIFFTEDYPELNADDSEVVTGYFVQVEVFSKGNYEALVKQVADLMDNAGFERISFRDDPYSKDTNMFHKVMTFTYIKGEI